MKVKEAIKRLNEMSPDDDVIIGWWTRDLSSDTYVIDDERWEQICEQLLDLTNRANEDVYNEILYLLERSDTPIKETE